MLDLTSCFLCPYQHIELFIISSAVKEKNTSLQLMKSGFAVNLQEFRKFLDSAKQMALILLSWKHCVYEIVTKFYSFNNDVSL